jgi:hypothetical protein
MNLVPPVQGDAPAPAPVVFEDGSIGIHPQTQAGVLNNTWVVLREESTGKLVAMPMTYAIIPGSVGGGEEWFAIGAYNDPKTVGQLMADPASIYNQDRDTQSYFGYEPPMPTRQPKPRLY